MSLPPRLRALVALAVATASGFLLVSTWHAVGGTPGLPPGESTLIALAQRALWVLGGYAAAVVGVASALALAGRPLRARALTRLVPAALRPTLVALLGVALTSGPAAAASPPPLPAAAGPVTFADPLDWAAPPSSTWPAAMADPFGERHVTRRAPPHRASTRTVRVEVGDSLWTLAARDLTNRHIRARPAAVDGAWRRWYAANRAVIGPDPGLLRPGELLLVPPPGPPTPDPSTYRTRRPR